jgi:hypothetical protein
MSTTFQPSLIDNLAQNINPWSWVSKIATGQIGFINVNLGKSSDPGLEQEILDDVGSYGRQLGQLGDALEAVLEHLKAETWKGDGKKAVNAFRFQLGEINRLKAKRDAAAKAGGA